MSWVCKYCSTSNEDSDKKCIVCDKDKSYGRDRILTRSAVEKLNLKGHVVIPSEYTAIGAEAFANRTDITSVTIHGEVTKIMREAFSCCINLTIVNCEGALNSIGEKAFYNCRALSKGSRPTAKKVASNAFDVEGSRPAPTPPKPTTSSRTTSYTPTRSTTTTTSTPSTRTTTPTRPSTPTRRSTPASRSSSSSGSGKHYSPVVKKIARAIVVLFVIAVVVVLIVTNMD